MKLQFYSINWTLLPPVDPGLLTNMGACCSPGGVCLLLCVSLVLSVCKACVLQRHMSSVTIVDNRRLSCAMDPFWRLLIDTRPMVRGINATTVGEPCFQSEIAAHQSGTSTLSRSLCRCIMYLPKRTVIHTLLNAEVQSLCSNKPPGYHVDDEPCLIPKCKPV